MTCRLRNTLDIFQLSSYLTFKQRLTLLFSPFWNTHFPCFHDNLLSWAFLLVRPSHGLCRLILSLAVPFSQCSRLGPRHPSFLSLSPSLHVLTLAHGFIWPCSYIYTNDSQCLSFDQFYLLYIGSLCTTIYLKSPHGLLKDSSDLTSPRSNSWSILSKPVYLPGFLY